MIMLLPIFLAAVWCGLAVVLPRVPSFRSARRVATLTVGSSAAICGVAWLAAGSGASVSARAILGTAPVFYMGGFAGLAPLVVSLIGVVAISLSDSISHRLATLQRILALLAIAMVFVVTREPILMAVLWGLSPMIAWLELRTDSVERGSARLFAIYQVPSVLLFTASVCLHSVGFAFASVFATVAAIGIREAVIPGHSWFLRFVERAPMGLVVAFIAPQLGVYAHIQMLGDALPEGLMRAVAVFGALTALVAASLGVVQSSARRALAYLMMSQTGLVAFGLEGASEVSFAGALLTWQVLALATSGFAMTVSALEARRGSLGLLGYSGCFARTPRMAAGFLVMGLASVGFPLTLGFVAEDLLVQGSVAEYPALAFVLIGATALNGMTVVRAFFRLFSGRSSHMGESDLTTREGWALSIVLLALLVGGIAPSMIVSREFGGAHAGASSPRDHPGSASLGSAPGIRAVVKGESMIEIHP